MTARTSSDFVRITNRFHDYDMIYDYQLIIIIIIQTFARHTLSASELNLRHRQSLGGEDG